MRRWMILCCVLLLTTPWVSCTRGWELTVRQEDGTSATFTSEQWKTLARAYPEQVQEETALALERVLWESGITAVESVQVAGQDYAWQDVYADSWLLKSGEVRMAGQTVTASEIVVTPPDQTTRLRLIDMTPTIAGALGISSPQGTQGHALGAFSTQQVILITIDGLSYLAYEGVRDQDVTPLLDSLAVPKLMLSSYPSTSEAAIAALLRGADTDKTQDAAASETLFDVLAAAGKTGVAVLPGSSAVELGPAKRILVEPASEDQDVTATAIDAALRVLQDESPALLWLHLDGLARAAATYGLSTDETTACLTAIDGQIQRLIAGAPFSGLILVLGTTGLHPPPAGETQGVISGTLLAADMYVPLWVIELS